MDFVDHCARGFCPPVAAHLPQGFIAFPTFTGAGRQRALHLPDPRRHGDCDGELEWCTAHLGPGHWQLHTRNPAGEGEGGSEGENSAGLGDIVSP